MLHETSERPQWNNRIESVRRHLMLELEENGYTFNRDINLALGVTYNRFPLKSNSTDSSAIRKKFHKEVGGINKTYTYLLYGCNEIITEMTTNYGLEGQFRLNDYFEQRSIALSAQFIQLMADQLSDPGLLRPDESKLIKLLSRYTLAPIYEEQSQGDLDHYLEPLIDQSHKICELRQHAIEGLNNFELLLAEYAIANVDKVVTYSRALYLTGIMLKKIQTPVEMLGEYDYVTGNIRALYDEQRELVVEFAKRIELNLGLLVIADALKSPILACVLLAWFCIQIQVAWKVFSRLNKYTLEIDAHESTHWLSTSQYDSQHPNYGLAKLGLSILITKEGRDQAWLSKLFNSRS